jgi:copper(I)-binding protein
MRKFILFFAIIFSLYSVINAESLLIDKYYYDEQTIAVGFDTIIFENVTNPDIIGGLVQILVYQFPQQNPEAGSASQVVLQSSAPSSPNILGRTGFSVDAGVFGYAFKTFSGFGSSRGNPCGSRNHLDNQAACSNPSTYLPVFGSGLNLDLSQKDFFAFEIVSLDIEAAANFLVRVWDINGGTGYANHLQQSKVILPSVTEPYKPLIIFPFSTFGNIDWANIRAISIEFNSTLASVDLIVGPLQALGFDTQKSSNPIVSQPSGQVTFNIQVNPDEYQTDNKSTVIQDLRHNITVVDTLPSDFISVDNVTVQANGTDIPFNYTINGTMITFDITILNGLKPLISYIAYLSDPFAFCTKQVCNNATVSLSTSFNTSVVSDVSKNISTCVDLITQPSLSTNYSSCPSRFTNQLDYIATICNDGNGLATNVQFLHQASSSLINCIPIFGGNCTGTECSQSVGDIPAGECRNVSISFDCSIYSTTCLSEIFNSMFSATEDCLGTTSSETCSLELNVGPPLVQISNSCPANISPSNQTTGLFVDVCNNGNGIARNVSILHTPSDALVNCSATISGGSCTGAECTTNLGDISPGDCTNLTIVYDCSTYATTCTIQTFTSTVSGSEDCGTSITNQTNSFTLDPGVADVQITTTSAQNISPSNQTTELFVDVCNNGNGIARNVSISHTPSDALVNCSATISSGSCTGTECTTNLGDISPGDCTNLTIVYDCSTYATTCTIQTFASTVSGTEDCGTSITNQTNSFTLDPGVADVQITTTSAQNISPSNQTTELFVDVCNNGNGIARNVSISHTPSDALVNCSATISSGSCTGTECTTNLGDISPGDCTNLTIVYDCSTYATTCTIQTFTSTVSGTEDCGTSITNQSCAFTLDPGVADVQITTTSAQNISPSNQTTELLVDVCNNGNGIARNVSISHTPSDALVNCSATISGGSCTGAECTTNLGDISPGDCTNLTIVYDCSTYATTCTIQNFASTISGTEDCGTSITNQTNSFTLDPGVSSITTVFRVTPTFDFSLQANSTSRVCNNGTGIARNVVFTHLLERALVNCSATISSGSCTGTECTTNLGDISPGDCNDIDVFYDCSTYTTECLVKSFSAQSRVTEDCGSSAQVTTPIFATDPSLAVFVNETLLNTAPTKTGQDITWSITATNLGNVTVKSYVLEKTYPEFTYPTNSTLALWNCSSERICILNGGSILSGDTDPVVLFTVTVLPNIPLNTTEVCNRIEMRTEPNEFNCFSTDENTNCAPVDPLIPDLVIKKSVYASRYTSKITYSNVGAANIIDLRIIQTLQSGWSLSPGNSGWNCNGANCVHDVASVSPGSSNVIYFHVNVTQTSQEDNSKCWLNFVNTTYDNENLDPTPENNYANFTVGSQCKKCCEPTPCPDVVCQKTCPDTNLIVNCTSPIQCVCEVPEFWCPPCTQLPPSCNCDQCTATGVQFSL